MQIEVPGPAARFEEALAETQGWTIAFAERVTDEYCGFLYLAATAGFEVTPSQAVDEAWHLHLSYPHYREVLCRRILGRTLEHRPATGEPGEEERHQRQYEDTLELYESVFGKPPPSDIWPRPIAREEEEDSEEAAEQGRRLSRRVAFVSLVGSLGALALGAPVIGVALAGAALLFFLLGQPSAIPTRGRGSGGCGGGGCGGSAASSDDCGASCGGSSCGGGGCGGD
jgi:uncharacterized membrane protein YgcG